jgi:signal transduction histidine kinase
MRRGRSIRWQLQVWHAVILLVVVGSFAATCYWQERSTRFSEIDTELGAGAEFLAAMLRRSPLPMLDNPDGRPRPPGPDHRRGRGPPPPNLLEALERELRLPGGPRREGGDADDYFVVWRRDGEVLRATTDEPPGGRPERPSGAGREPAFRTVGERRELLRPGPAGTLILVGRPIVADLAALRRLSWLLLGSGAGVLVLGLFGGHLLSRGAVAPIERMTAAATCISATNLSRRIDPGDAANELVALAGTLNDAFARLEVAFDQKSRFTADASHELRTPLSVILSHTELALERPRDANDYRQALSACQHAALRMKSLVESLLTLARLDGRSPPEVVPRRRQLDLLPGLEPQLPAEARDAVPLPPPPRPAPITGERRARRSAERLREPELHELTGGTGIVAEAEHAARDLDVDRLWLAAA